MSEAAALELEEYRDYLGMLARLQMSDDLEGKIDLSGVVQLSLLEAARSSWQELPNADRAPWLRKLLANNLLDEIRKFRAQSRDVSRERSLQASLDHSASRVGSWLASDLSSPSKQAVRAEEAVHLARALERLPEAQREAVEKHYLQGKSIDEISRSMQKTKGAVAALVFRGTTKLREILTTLSDPDNG